VLLLFTPLEPAERQLRSVDHQVLQDRQQAHTAEMHAALVSLIAQHSAANAHCIKC
jgi:hypothetical protein